MIWLLNTQPTESHTKLKSMMFKLSSMKPSTLTPKASLTKNTTTTNTTPTTKSYNGLMIWLLNTQPLPVLVLWERVPKVETSRRLPSVHQLLTTKLSLTVESTQENGFLQLSANAMSTDF